MNKKQNLELYLNRYQKLKEENGIIENQFSKDKIDKEKSISTNNIEYYGLILTEKGLSRLRNCLKHINVTLVSEEQHNMHMTCEYFEFKSGTKKVVPDPKDLGKIVNIKLSGFGTYVNENGIILNQGFEVDKKSLQEFSLITGENLLQLTKNDIPHITVSINKPIAKAINTSKCDFESLSNLGFNEDLIVECRLALFNGKNVFYNIENYSQKEYYEEPQKNTYERKALSFNSLATKKPKISQNALSIIKTIQDEGYEAYLVGGCVRDSLLGIPAKDEDITTDMLPEETIKLFTSKGYTVIPTGIKHGTVSVIMKEDNNKVPYEITTYRIDGFSSDSRHPDEVFFTKELKEDMSRRDFTINAMAYNPFESKEQSLKDYFNGKEDLKNGIIRTVGNPHERIKEDALRMIRAVRFAAQKNMRLADDLILAIQEDAQSICNVSKERINQELTKIMLTDNPSTGIYDLHSLNILKYICPELDSEYYTFQNNPWHLYNVGKHTERVIDHVSNNKIIRFAALFHDLGKTVTRTTDIKGIDHFYNHPSKSEELCYKILRDLKFTNVEIIAICKLVKKHDDRFVNDKNKIINFIVKNQDFSESDILNLIELQEADMKGQNPEKTKEGLTEIKLARQTILNLFKFPHKMSHLCLNGKDIMNINIDSKGKHVQLLKEDIRIAKNILLQYVMQFPDKNTPLELEEYLRKNLRAIKNESINQISPSLKTKEREILKIRTAIEKLKKEIVKFSVDNSLLLDCKEDDSTINGFIRINESYDNLLEKLRDYHSSSNPTIFEFD